SFDFSPESYYLYYVSNIYDPNTREIIVELNRADLINGQVEFIDATTKANPESQIRRFRNGKMYLAGYTKNELDVFSNPDGAFTTSTFSAYGPTSNYILQSTLHTNTPVKIKKVELLFANISSRKLEKKKYELTDHLGNVRIVV